MAIKKFSIITVVYNDLAGLKVTRKSIQNQLFTNFEWVVCDGGSGMESQCFLSSLGNEVKWVSQKDEGIYDAMNKGIAMSSGDYIVFMNAGDTFNDDNVLAKVAIFLSGNDKVVDILFGGAMLQFSASGRSVYRPPRSVEKSLWHGLPANHQATFYRRASLYNTPYDLTYKLCGDYYLAATLIRNGSTPAYLDIPLARFEVGGQSYTRRKQLFTEPYLIQRDVLGIPLYYRLASLLKRFISTVGFVLLSQPVLTRKKVNKR